MTSGRGISSMVQEDCLIREAASGELVMFRAYLLLLLMPAHHLSSIL